METKTFTYLNLYSFATESYEENKVLADNFKSALSYANIITTTPILNHQQHSLRNLKTIGEQIRIYKDIYKCSITSPNLPFIKLSVWFVNFGNNGSCYVAAKTLADVYDYIGGEHKNIKEITTHHLIVYLKKKTDLV